MSEQLLYVFFSDNKLAKDKKTGGLWKVVMRTGTWKLRPGPGGVKLKEPLKILRDKAPAGHISLSSLKTNFDAGAKENVTIPVVHADGTTADSGFVRELRIEDVKGEDGKVVESKLWANMDITDSDLKKKVEEKSMVGCSGGVLFDYERTEDGKKFDQILSHVMATNSPWIGGTGGYEKKLPAGVMAAEDGEVPYGEVEFDSAMLDYDDVPSGSPPAPVAKPAEGTVVWKPEEGFQAMRDKVQKSLREWRQTLLAQLPPGTVDYEDFPSYYCNDVSMTGAQRQALIACGYGDDADSWVAGFSLDADGEVAIDRFQDWVPAKKEWVAASEQVKETIKLSEDAPPARPSTPVGLSLEQAQGWRVAQAGPSFSTTSTTGGHTMSRLADLLKGVELSDEQRAAISDADAREEKLLKDAGETRAKKVLGKLDDLGLGEKDSPGFRKTIRDIVLSDDQGVAIMLSETTDTGARTQGVATTATAIVERLVDALPRDKDGKLSLSQQATKLPDDPKPRDGEEKPEGDSERKFEGTPRERAKALLDEGGMGAALNVDSKRLVV